VNGALACRKCHFHKRSINLPKLVCIVSIHYASAGLDNWLGAARPIMEQAANRNTSLSWDHGYVKRSARRPLRLPHKPILRVTPPMHSLASSVAYVPLLRSQTRGTVVTAKLARQMAIRLAEF
jgi:hypothetical protein